MSDLLERIRGEIRERLEASRQAVNESKRLQRALQALDDSVSSQAGAEPEDAGSSSRRRRVKSSAGLSAEQRRADRVLLLEVLGQRPGVTREELRGATGRSGASVAQHLRRLVEQGQVREQQLPGGQTGYALATSAPGHDVAHDSDEAPGTSGATELASGDASVPSTDRERPDTAGATEGR